MKRFFANKYCGIVITDKELDAFDIFYKASKASYTCENFSSKILTSKQLNAFNIVYEIFLKEGGIKCLE